MAFTRFNYDYQRTAKLLQESTGPGRYVMNTPGPGGAPAFFEDPHIRLQHWGANVRAVPNSTPVDIASDLDGRTRRLKKYCNNAEYPNQGVPTSHQVNYPTQSAYTDETRTSHPVWMYRGLEQPRWEYPLLNPQENVCKHFNNNLNTRILEKDNYIPKYPVLQSNIPPSKQ